MNKVTIKLFLLVLFLGGISALADDGGFLFVTFKGEQTPDSEQIYFAISADGRHWNALNDAQPVLVSTVGEQGVRDPYLLRSHDGKKFCLLATDLSINRNGNWSRAQRAGSQSIVIWESTNLVNWSPPRLVKVAPDDAGCTWAPEAVYDETKQEYLVFWASRTADDHYAKQRIWAAWTKDFAMFSKPFVYIEKPWDVIDTDIVNEGENYYRFSKDEQFKSITMEVSTNLMGLWREVPDFSLAKVRGYEGPECYQIKPAMNGQPAMWCLILDQYSKGTGYHPFITEDLGSGRFKPGEDFDFPFRFRHGSVMRVDAEEYQRLKKNVFSNVDQADVPKPILDGFTADPAIRLFGDTYYIYPTSDKPNWMTTDFSVWSSKNLVTWKKEGMVLDVAHDLKWANIKAWAPDCIERNGKFYFYFCADGKIGVATADKPTGPFVDALGHPLIQKSDQVKTYPIDPYPFMDSDGQAYLYFGNGTAMVYKLNPDMISFNGDPTPIRLEDFREGIVVFKRAGRYYFMWSVDDARSDNYRVGYGISDSPYGPVTSPANFIVLRKHGLVKGTGHNSVVNVPGTDRWYVVYHRHAIPGGNGYKRETCLVRMEFNPDGTIKPMDPMTTPFHPGDVGEPINASKNP